MDRKRDINNIFVFIFGFVSAVFVSSFIFISPLVGAFFIVIGAAIYLVEKIWTGFVNKEALLVILILISAGTGILRYSIKDFHQDILPEKTGIVISEPELRENTTRFVMRSRNGEKVLVNAGLYSEIQYGDSIRIKGKLEKPGIIENSGGNSFRQFDYGKYLSKDDIYYLVNFAEIEILSHGHGRAVKTALLKIKNIFIFKIKQIFAEPEASLISGLIIAGKASMPRDILDTFKRTGIIHIVVLSGYNITIVAEFIRKAIEKIFLSPLFHSRLGLAASKIGAGTSIFGILLFVLMTGAEATVVRAAIMVFAAIASKFFGRTYSAYRALVGAAFLMLLENPKILVFDPSFQLSFLATCGLIFFSPMIEKRLIKLRMPEGFGARSILATTVATQITVLPLLIYSVGEVSVVSLPVNLLVLGLIPCAMFLGFFSALAALIHFYIALPVAYVAHIILAWILWVANYFGNLSFASIAVPAFPFWIVAGLYLLMTIFLVHRENFSPRYSNSN